MKFVNPTGKKQIQVQAQEVLEIWLEDFDDGVREFDLEINLIGEGAACHIQGRAQTVGADQKRWRIVQNFHGSNQTGSITVRGVAEDQSYLHIDGAATLKQTSTEAEANISEKIMLFGDGKGKLLPILRVETDNVKGASHAASIAPVEPEKLLFFARSGVAQKQAEQIIKTGFLK